MKKNEKSIFYMLFFRISIVLIVTFSVMTIFVLGIWSNVYRKSTVQNMTQSFSVIETKLNLYYQQLIHTISQIDLNTELYSYLSQESINSNDYYRWNRSVTEYLSLFSAFSDTYKTQIILSGANGNIYAINPGMISSELIMRPEILQQSMNQPNKVHLDIVPIDNESQKYQLTMTKAIRNRYSKKYQGNIFITFKEESLYHLYSSTINESNRISIVNEQGVIITDSNRSKISSNSDIYSIIQQNFQLYEKPQLVNVDDKQYWIIAKQIKFNNCYLIEVIDNSYFWENFNRIFITVLCFGGLCILFSGAIILKAVQKITVPIRSLSHEMSQYRKYIDGSSALQLSGCAEVTKATTAFNSMMDKLKYYIQENNTHTQKLHEIELQTLQMQINPHFMCNILASFKQLIILGQVQEAESSITALSHLVKNTLGNLDTMICLVEEIDLTNSFFQLQKFRYSTKGITLITQIPEELKYAEVPKLILQPFVENCIFHAFDKNTKHGTIHIIAYQQEQDLIIEILDNGKGMDSKIRDNLLSDQQPNVLKRFNKIGVKNVHERLQIQFGESYGVSVYSEPKIGSSFTLRIPLFIPKKTPEHLQNLKPDKIID